MFANFWRYASFAIANQIFTTCEKYSTDSHEVIKIIKDNYPRAAGLPYPGLAAGPCLYKDTIQLIASLNNEFSLGTAIANVNEGVIYSIANKAINLQTKFNKKILIMGASFKADNDDTRSSLAFKLHKTLILRSNKDVIFYDPLVKHPKVTNKVKASEISSSIIVLATPHKIFKTHKKLIQKKLLVDIWNFF